MKAAFLTGPRRMEIRDIPMPRVERDDDVLLRVQCVGVCGSDVHYFRTGRIGSQVVTYPWLVGHEFSGTVVEAGKSAGLAAGELVAVDPLVWCNRCDQCRTGRFHTCRNQTFLGCPGQMPGCLCEYIVMPARCCVKAGGLSAEAAAVVEPFSIGLYAARLARVGQGARVGILGSGPIGLCVMLALRTMGAHTIYMTDLLDERVAMARRLGAHWAGSAAKQDVPAELRRLEPLGLDVVFECAGEQATLDQAVAMLRPGGTLMLVGIPEIDRVSFAIDTMRRKELLLQNVRRQNECVEPAVALVRGGQADLAPLVTHRFGLEQTQQAFELVDQYKDGVVKAVINPQS